MVWLYKSAYDSLCVVCIVSYISHCNTSYIIYNYDSATHAIESDATYPKGYYRRGTAEFGKLDLYWTPY